MTIPAFSNEYERLINHFNRKTLECERITFPVIIIGEKTYNGYIDSVWKIPATHIWLNEKTNEEYLCNFITAYGSANDYVFPYQPDTFLKTHIKLHYVDDKTAYVLINHKRIYVTLNNIPHTTIPYNDSNNMPLFSLHFQIGVANPCVSLNISFYKVMKFYREWKKNYHVLHTRWGMDNILFANFRE